MENKPRKPRRIDKVMGKNIALFGEDFRRGNITWKKAKLLPSTVIGRILVCHLLIEIHIDKYLELTIRDINIKKADLSFSQKMHLISSHPIITEHFFYDGIVAINKIRNKLAHNLLSEINVDDVKTILGCLKGYNEMRKKEKMKLPTLTTFTHVGIVEFFTMLFTSFMAGACTSATGISMTS